MKTAVITDTTCDLPKEIMAENNIFCLPIRILYSDREYLDGIDITPAEVIASLDREVPKTSLPSPEHLQNLIDQLVNDGYQRIVGVFMTSAMSGTFNMARQIFAADKRVETKIYDTKTVSLELGFTALGVAEKIKAGVQWEDMDNVYKEVRNRTSGIFTVNTLKYMQLCGRVGRVEGGIGKLLNIKPVVYVDREEGIYYTLKKCRGRKRSISTMLKVVAGLAPKKFRIGIVHSAALHEAEAIKAEIEERFDFAKVVMIRFITPSLGLCAGPGLLGIIWQEIV